MWRGKRGGGEYGYSLEELHPSRLQVPRQIQGMIGRWLTRQNFRQRAMSGSEITGKVGMYLIPNLERVDHR